jgi:hypothetical protein
MRFCAVRDNADGLSRCLEKADPARDWRRQAVICWNRKVAAGGASLDVLLDGTSGAEWMNLNSDFGTRAAVHAARLDWMPSPIPGVDRRMLDRIGDEWRARPRSSAMPRTAASCPTPTVAARSSPGSRGSDSRPAQRCKQLQDKAAAWSGSSRTTSHVSRCGQLHADVLKNFWVACGSSRCWP